MAAQKATEPFGTLGRELKKKISNDNDSKVIITGTSSQTGIGKSTLALALCWYIEGGSENWPVEDRAFIELYNYIDAYKDESNTPPGSALLWDEMEHGADKRNPMSHGNKAVRQVFAKYRYRNIVTVGTLPTVSMLDGDLLELSDYWINVMGRGYAHPYEIHVNDYTGEIRRKRVTDDRGNREVIKFPDLGDHPHKEYLDQLKREITVTGEKLHTSKDIKKERRKAKRTASLSTRNEIILQLDDLRPFTVETQEDIGNVVGLKQEQISRILNDNKEEE